MVVPYFLFQSSRPSVAFNTSTGYLGPEPPRIPLREYQHKSMEETGIAAAFARVTGRDMYSRTVKTAKDMNLGNPGSLEHLVGKKRRDGKWDVFRVVHVENPPAGYYDDHTFYYQEEYAVTKEVATEAIRLFDAAGELKQKKGYFGPRIRSYPGNDRIKDYGLCPR
jgi:hypothetical protein